MTSKKIDLTSSDGGKFQGYLALPPTGVGPGIVLIQEIFGVNAHIRAVADQYALDGYVVLAPDLFWRMQPGLEIGYGQKDFETGMDFLQKLDMKLAVQDISVAVQTLRSLPACTGKVASLGYCMGGLLSYLTAADTDVDAAICYYPGAIDSHLDRATAIHCPILIHFAGKDRFISSATVEAVRGKFSDARNAVIEVHPDVDHGFNCWERGSYNQRASSLAHGLSLSFLAKAY